jgi:hypothetical protein
VGTFTIVNLSQSRVRGHRAKNAADLQPDSFSALFPPRAGFRRRGTTASAPISGIAKCPDSLRNSLQVFRWRELLEIATDGRDWSMGPSRGELAIEYGERSADSQNYWRNGGRHLRRTDLLLSSGIDDDRLYKVFFFQTATIDIDSFT